MKDTQTKQKISKLPNIETDFAGWYQDIVYRAELADQSPVRGSIVIRPYGYNLWEHIRSSLDKKIKDTGHENASFPLLIPLSFLQKEAEHVEGFAPEIAVVTHAGGKELEEPFVIRPTSETMIHYMFARWIRSWRDLPLKINQWANVIRWEMRTRPFLRTSEFHWQEGHTAHETHQEALDETHLMLKQYEDLIQNELAIPVVAAQKPESERFAGADITLTLEGLMPDGKALQMGTSHMISQNFAKSFQMTYQDRAGNLAYPYLTSWGVTTRLIGAVVMVHGDQKGLILPPRIAPIQVIVIPIAKADSREHILAQAQELLSTLLAYGIRAKIDATDYKTPGAKFFEWELKGVPVRIEMGPRDITSNQVTCVNRLTGEKNAISISGQEKKLLGATIEKQLNTIQEQLFQRACKQRDNAWFKEAKLTHFANRLEKSGGFFQTGWCGQIRCEQKLKEIKATIRCVLKEKIHPHCFNCEQTSDADILIARSY